MAGERLNQKQSFSFVDYNMWPQNNNLNPILSFDYLPFFSTEPGRELIVFSENGIRNMPCDVPVRLFRGVQLIKPIVTSLLESLFSISDSAHHK